MHRGSRNLANEKAEAPGEKPPGPRLGTLTPLGASLEQGIVSQTVTRNEPHGFYVAHCLPWQTETWLRTRSQRLVISQVRHPN